MAIKMLDPTEQKVAERKQANFVIELADRVIQVKPPQLLRFDEQSTTVSGVFVDAILHHWYTWQLMSTANPLAVIWQRKEDVSAVPHEPSEEELLDSWNRYLEEHRDELVAQYKGKYVAIWKDAVYDSDEDLAALAERVYTALGYRRIFMPHIGEQRRVAEFLSPV